VPTEAEVSGSSAKPKARNDVSGILETFSEPNHFFKESKKMKIIKLAIALLCFAVVGMVYGTTFGFSPLNQGEVRQTGYGPPALQNPAIGKAYSPF
jgi:hypothetical protein